MSALIGEAYAKDTLCSDKTAQDELVEALVMDADTLKDQTLQEHDRIHHKDGYHEGDTCKFRDKMKEETPEDQADELSLGKGNRQSSKDNKQQVKLTDLANRIKGFIKGVTVRFADKPYEQGEDEEGVRRSIRASEQANWNRILDAFENHTEEADATRHHTLLDHTPAVLRRLGVKDLPITIMGGVIHKMIGNIRNSEYDYHNIPISELRNLLIDLDNPIAVFESDSQANALVILTPIIDRHGDLKSIVPLKLDRKGSGSDREHVIATAYGKKPQGLQKWIDDGYLLYVNKEALRKSAQRLQLPRDSILKTRGVLTENDFSSEQLGHIIPDSSAAVKGVEEKKVTTNPVISFRNPKGEVVGTYNRETNEIVVYPGADADTIGHELCGHATWQYAEQQARKGDSRLLEKMQEVVDAPAAKPVWDEVKANYEGEDRAVQREEVWAHIIGHRTSKAIEEIQKSRSGRRWYQKFWNVVKDAWKGLLSTVRINSVHLEGTEEMSPKEFSEYIVKQMLERKTLGNISKEGGEEEGAERKSIRSKPLVTPEEDAAYMETVEKGDMETASKMVREAAAKAMPDTKVSDKRGCPLIVFHGSPYEFTEFGKEDKSNSMYHKFIQGLFFFTDDARAAEKWKYGKERKGSGAGDLSKLENLIADKKEFLDFIEIYEKTNGQIPADIEYRAFHTNRIFNGVEESIAKTKELADKGQFDYRDNPVIRQRQKIKEAINRYIEGDVKEKEIIGKLYRVFLNVKNPNIVDGDKVSPTSKWQDDFDGMDGMIIHNSDIGNAIATEYIVDNPHQIKSADPVTYDDNGNVIPLSRRFDDGDDIRGDVSGKTEYIEKMKTLHPNINPEELINRLKGLGSREEMEAEIAKILGNK